MTLRVSHNWPWPYRPPWPNGYYGQAGAVAVVQIFLERGVRVRWQQYGMTRHGSINPAVVHWIVFERAGDIVFEGSGTTYEVDAARLDASPPPGSENWLRELYRFDAQTMVPLPKPPILPVSASPTITIHARANLPHPVRVTTGDREGWTAHIDPLLRRDGLVLRPGDTVTMDRVQYEHCSGLDDLRSRGYIYEV